MGGLKVTPSSRHERGEIASHPPETQSDRRDSAFLQSDSGCRSQAELPESPVNLLQYLIANSNRWMRAQDSSPARMRLDQKSLFSDESLAIDVRCPRMTDQHQVDSINFGDRPGSEGIRRNMLKELTRRPRQIVRTGRDFAGEMTDPMSIFAIGSVLLVPCNRLRCRST